MEMDRLTKLSEKVEHLLAKTAELAKAKKELGQILEKKEGEIKALKEQVASLEQERVQVQTKVDELLERIDQYLAG